MKNFRNKGAIGALLDEYEKAVLELNEVLDKVTTVELLTVVDAATKDPDCHSIQTILNHVVRSGYGYMTMIRNHLGEQNERVKCESFEQVETYQQVLLEMFAYNDKFLEDYPDVKLEQLEMDKKILVSWGQHYDIEQLLEHAIVHILRHRRQIERFLEKLREES